MIPDCMEGGNAVEEDEDGGKGERASPPSPSRPVLRVSRRVFFWKLAVRKRDLRFVELSGFIGPFFRPFFF